MELTKIEAPLYGEEYYRIEHRSGLKILICPKKGFRSVYARIGTRFGSIDSKFECDGRIINVPDGTAHYLEHKLFESEDGDAFSKYAKTGASANAFTSFDMTCYLFSCTENFEESLRILFDLIQSPYFTEETVAKEQGIIGQEIKMYQDSPDWRVMMDMLQGMYSEHPINIDIAGTVETISHITPEVLYDCYNSYYNLNNMVLTVVGGVDPKQVLRIADEKLRTDKPLTANIILPDEPYKVKTRKTSLTLPVALPIFNLGFKEQGGGYCTDQELVATTILLDAFIGPSTELYREMFDKKLINLNFGHEYMEGLGYRSVIISGETREPEAVAEYIDSAVRKLHRNGVDRESFERAKRVAYGTAIGSLNSKQAVSSELMNAEFTGRNMYDGIREISEMTLDKVNERLSVELDPDNTCLSIVTPE